MINLRKLRTEKGMSQQALADKFNLSQQSIYKYEHSLAEPDIKTLKKLADFFEVSIDFLVGYSNNPETKKAFIAMDITKEEIQLLQRLRQLSPEIYFAINLLIDNLTPS